MNILGLKELWQETLGDPSVCIAVLDGPVDQLDHSALRESFGGKIGIDATEKHAEDGHDRGWPEELQMSEEIRTLVDKKWQSYGLWCAICSQSNCVW